MNNFKVTEDRRIFLGETEIQRCANFKVIVEAGCDPEVELRVSVDSIDIDGYTDFWTRQMELDS